MGESRKAFHFDLSTKELMEHYPSDKKFGWRKAWSDIRSFMEQHGFEHSQFSGYESIEPMGYDMAYAIMKSLNETYPWFSKCAHAATYTDIGERFDILTFLNSEVKDEEPTPEHAVSSLGNSLAPEILVFLIVHFFLFPLLSKIFGGNFSKYT